MRPSVNSLCRYNLFRKNHSFYTTQKCSVWTGLIICQSDCRWIKKKWIEFISFENWFASTRSPNKNDFIFVSTWDAWIVPPSLNRFRIRYFDTILFDTFFLHSFYVGMTFPKLNRGLKTVLDLSRDLRECHHILLNHCLEFVYCFS